ncbi:MAG: hypothetical protein H6712_23330 [Myxococcales bacterium]|nr:hypothetical protein [Myxococcales bacterium]MCB9716810.1 hypothetical protein [Myxococcales bacterium]
MRRLVMMIGLGGMLGAGVAHAAPAPEPEPVPESERPLLERRETGKTFTIIGFGMFAVTYGVMAGIGGAGLAKDPGNRVSMWMTIPVVGPFGAIGALRRRDGRVAPVGVVGLSVVGLGQAATLTLGILGSIILARTRHDVPRAASLTVLPQVWGPSLGYSWRF